MKAVCFSDTHKTPLLDKLELPEADFGLFAGDCSFRGKEAEYRSFIDWFANQPVTHKVFVPGNHDWYTETNLIKAMRIAEIRGVVFLSNTEVTLDGYRIYGTPIQPEFMNWAWNQPLLCNRDACFAKIPEGLDVLITHCPPYGILDDTPPNVFNKGNPENVGCTALRDHVLRAKPRFHVFGHIHHSYGQKSQDGTLFVNASICTEKYQLTNNPIIIDLDQDNSPVQC
jgi:Icc-related predicted phosphoesterase